MSNWEGTNDCVDAVEGSDIRPARVAAQLIEQAQQYRRTSERPEFELGITDAIAGFDKRCVTAAYLQGYALGSS